MAASKALAQSVQEQLLGDAGGVPPVGGELSHSGFRWQIPMVIRRPDGFTDGQISSHDARTSQHTGEKPLCRPPPEAPARRQTGNHGGVWLVTQRG